ncbi:MAG: GerMN domain-containing protein [Treponema sp.]|jgi:spore germination protein GerM|nr:GerMN domain-containing protein [Treponema sp.]
MATRKNNNKKESKKSQIVLIFWLIFIIVIISIFLINAETIQRNFGVFCVRITSPSGNEEVLLLADDIPLIDERTLDDQTPAVRVEIVEQPVVTPQTEPAQPSAELPVEQPAATPQAEPAQQPATTQQTPPQQPIQPVTPPAQTRDRTIYFAQVSGDGQILHTRVTRRLPVSQTPMQDVLNALLAGPSAEELSRGILNLIPQNTRMLSAIVRGDTAYINFSEDFLFTTFGVEGYVAQLRQIVWTVTEFQNIRDVQFLIEGRRMDYLGEGIWIGSPISRLSF